MKHILLVAFFIGGIFYTLSAQSRLSPVGRLSLSDYYEKCDELLTGSDEGRSTDFIFTARPSFSAESACYYYDKDSVFVFCEADKMIFRCYNFGYPPSTRKQMSPRDEVRVTRYQCPVSPEIAKHFKSLFTAAVLSSSYLAKEAQSAVLDGTIFDLSIGDRYRAECYSPREGNCYELVKILGYLSEAIKSNDPSAIEKMIPDVDALCQAFEGLYPDDLEIAGESI